MDKLLRRVRMNERQVLRRLKRREELAKRGSESHEQRQFLTEIGREAGLSLKKAIVARHEDWELGPLAPRRDVPKILKYNPTEQNHYGTLSINRALNQVKLRASDLEERCRWAGGSENLCLAEGDRVVIMEGAHKGKIDKIVSINMDYGTVRLQDLKVNVTLPSYFVGFAGMSETASIPARIPLSSIRLVHPIKDEETGITKDVIIKELRPIKIVRDRVTRTQTWSRMVPGLNVTLPWPKAEQPVEEERACDTPRIHVEENTFIPTLLRPPMPEELVDELRNRYSKFRTRHTDEYIAKKEAEEAEKLAAKQKAKEMLTPVQELNRLEREKRRARGQPALTEEMLAKIGEVMARNLNGQKANRAPLTFPAETKKVEDAPASS